MMNAHHEQGTAVELGASQRFLSALWSDGIPEGLHLLIWTKDRRGGKRSAWFTSLEPAVAFIAGQAEADVYLGCGLSARDLGPSHRCPSEQIAAIPGLWADLDIADPAHQKGNLPPTMQDALGLLGAVPGLPPSLVVHSGHGLHAWWLFKEPWTFDQPQERAQAAALCRRLQQALKDKARERGWDVDSTADLARVLRLPGTWNHKGNPPVMVALGSEGGRAHYNPDDFEDCLPPDPGPARRVNIRAVVANKDGLCLDPLADPPQARFDALKANEPRFGSTWEHQRSDLQDQSLSSYDMALASFAALAGWSDQEISDLLIAHRRRYGNDADREKALRLDYIGGTITRARGEDGLSADAQAILSMARETKDTAAIIEAASRLARLPQNEWVALRPKLNQALPSLNLKELGQVVESCRRQQRQEETGRHQVLVNNRQLRDVMQETIEGIKAQNEPPSIFVRAGKLVRFRVDEKGSPLAEPLTENSLRVVMTQKVDFCRELKGGLKDDTPTPELIKSVLSLGRWPFPVLEGITETPTMREDGTILDRPGYDEHSGFYYFPAPGLLVPAISEKPSKDEAQREARFIMDEVIPDFPFADQASKANMLGCLLTPIIRQALGDASVPLALIDAPQAGTGKSLLGELVALITTGRPASMHGGPGRNNEDEWRKAITAILLEGATIVCFDNVDGVLDSPSLARALSAKVWSDRVLGSSQKVAIPNRATWIANGNNIALGGDLPRRCYLIRLDAKVSRPWEREGFKRSDLLSWLQVNRGQIIAALLTMVCAWGVAGKPKTQVPALGGFQQWCNMVGGILHFAGVQGFLANLKAMYQNADVEGEQWERFLAAIFYSVQKERQTADAAWKTADLVKLSRGLGEGLREALPDALADAVETAPGGVASRKMGAALRRAKGVRYGKAAVHVEEGPRDRASNTGTWLVKVDRPQELCPAPEPTEGHVATLDACPEPAHGAVH